MPSFDIVSKVDAHEIRNAVDQANREVGTRFDFKGTDARYELVEEKITLFAETDFQLKQMYEILIGKLAKRQVDILVLDPKDPEIRLHEARQQIDIRQGIAAETAKVIVKCIKDKKLKVQAAIQGDQVRVTGKKRDDLQEVIAVLKQEKFGLPLQFENFRD
ncbi:MAG TPA: YajQ family cyclic di-GMP-binding protein [Gammaproteobacteria bacterium]|nr:YajQ family cyclic di-GMP-binding protein [Gammaproteobacteria bacterium]